MKRTFLLISLLYNVTIVAHGFGGNTLVYLGDGTPIALEKLCHRIEKSYVQVASSNPRHNTFVRKQTRLYGKSTSNCYMRLSFCNACNDGDIICTPSQPFYRVSSNCWVQACDLRIGDVLKAKGGGKETITRMVFVPEPINVYTICVSDTHTFFVGKHAILTHNMVLTALPLFVKLGCAFGSGAVSGSFLGPIGICFGVSAAALACCVIHAISGHRISYRIQPYNFDLLTARFDQGVDSFSVKGPCITVVPSDPMPPCIFVPVSPVSPGEPQRGCGGIPSELQGSGIIAGGCGEINVPTIQDTVLSHPIPVSELPIIYAQDVATSGEKVGVKRLPKPEEVSGIKGDEEALPIRELDYGHSAVQYDLLKQEYERLELEAKIEEFKSIVGLTEHGLQRLLEREFTVEEVKSVLQNPDYLRIQSDGAKVFIQKIGDRYRIIVLNEETGEVVTALRRTTEKKIRGLAKNYGWEL